MANLLTDAYVFEFSTRGGTRLEFKGSLESWSDQLSIRLANFHYLKRDGGESEPMGADQARFSFRCVYLGADWSKQYRSLAAAIRREPRGLLVHPILGKWSVACEGIQADSAPGQALNTINFSISFVEDQVDQAIQAQDPGPQQRAGQVTQNSQALTALVAPGSRISAINIVSYNQVAASVSSYTIVASRFITAALTAAQSTLQDPSLDRVLGLVGTQLGATLTVLHATGLVDAELYPLTSLAREIYSGCIETFNAVRAQKPPLINFVIPATLSLSVLAARLYGQDARTKIEEILLLNRIPNPYAIPVGTVLRVSAPPVRQ